MLPPFIIEQIRQREEQEQARRHEQPRLELPLEQAPPVNRQSHEEEEDKDRGVIVLDLV
jgi:hypothetical protein